MQEHVDERGTPVVAALTKGVTRARAARARREGDLRSALELEEDQMIVTSARDKEGIDDLREAIAGLIRRPPRDPGRAPGVSAPPRPYYPRAQARGSRQLKPSTPAARLRVAAASPAPG